MKVLVFSNPSLADHDIPLVKALLEKGIDVTYLIELNSKGSHDTILSIQHGHEFNGIEPASSYQELSIFSNYIPLDKVFIRNYYRRHAIPLIDAFVLSIKTFLFINNHRFDLIQRTQVFFRTDILLYLFRRRLIKIVHDPFSHSGSKMRRETKFFYNLGMRLIPRFVVLNKRQYEDFCRVYRIDKKNVLLNQLGVYDCYNLYRKSSTHTQFQQEVLYFGRIAEYKGIEYLCAAMEMVHESIPNACVTIAGGGHFYFDIKPYEQLPYFNVINRYVTAQELSGLLERCAVVVCPYTDSTQSGVAMTAFSMAKPIIASDVGGLSEQIDNGKSGLLVPPRNSNELANAIIQLLKSDSLRESMSEYITKVYQVGARAWRTIAERYVCFYKECIY